MHSNVESQQETKLGEKKSRSVASPREGANGGISESCGRQREVANIVQISVCLTKQKGKHRRVHVHCALTKSMMRDKGKCGLERKNKTAKVRRVEKADLGSVIVRVKKS